MPKIASVEKCAPEAASPRSAQGGDAMGRFGFFFPPFARCFPFFFLGSALRFTAPLRLRFAGTTARDAGYVCASYNKTALPRSA